MHKIFKTRTEQALRYRIESILLPNIGHYNISDDSKKILEGIGTKHKQENLVFVNTERRRIKNQERVVPQIVVTDSETEAEAEEDPLIYYKRLLRDAAERERRWIQENLDLQEEMKAVVGYGEDLKEEVERLRRENEELREKNGKEEVERLRRENEELRKKNGKEAEERAREEWPKQPK
ncbi:hypothetical protein FOCC_FOCC008039 [Frankliniella occidentalis]|uniref:Uncharacterized protein LOC127749715 n=1 Tax=Frankliniella occidentalis TaxID=133901 RepID=A0A9C6U8J9_FRAOC|nr:uncharacterized protein LOC127749715 [Frankliniella occidentalis]KAE8745247.1 hypothetical protein FOCC_FOCC008039 [Frankliniella occidentalis]